MKFFYRLIKNNIRVAYGVIVIVTISSLSACVTHFNERARSEQLFEQYCNEEGRVGQFIYERVALGEEYFRPIPTVQRELNRIADSYYIDNKKLLIDKERFIESYTRNFLKRKELSPTGPIYTIESTIVRKSDGKVLSKAVSLLNNLGKTSKYFPAEGVTCPTGRNSKGQTFFHEKHMTLIENTFFKQEQNIKEL